MKQDQAEKSIIEHPDLEYLTVGKVSSFFFEILCFGFFLCPEYPRLQNRAAMKFFFLGLIR